MPRSMQGRLLVSMAILIALPLLVITIVGGAVYARGIDEQATDYSAEMLEEVHTNIESYIHTVDQIIEYLSRDEAVIRFLRLKDSYVLTPEKLKTAKPDMCILHPLPRVNEISVKVDDDPRACYFKQVLNGKYMRMALILKLLEEAKA